jgi:hypothetical protein
MTHESEKDNDLQKKHPYRFFWLTAGLVSILSAIIAVAVALSSTGSSTTSTGSSSPTGQNSSVPLSYQGTWQGTMSYPGYASVNVTLELGPGSIGQVVGQYTNTVLDCVWAVYLAQNGTTLQLHWILKSSPSGSTCVSSVYATATLLNQTSLNVAETADPNTGVIPRSGTLTRTS